MSVLKKLDAYQQSHRWLAFPLAVVKKFGDDQAGNLAALVAYFAFFSLFPLLLVFVTILGFVLQGDASAQHSVEQSVRSQFPGIGKSLQLSALHGHAIVLVIGIATSLLSGLGVTNAAQQAMDRVWAVPFKARPNFVKSRLRGLALLFSLGATFIVATFASGLVTGGLGGPLLTVAGIVFSLLLNVALFLAAFRMMTAPEVPTRDLMRGVCFAAVAWELLQAVGGIYIGHVEKHWTGTYASIGFVIGLLVWLHLGSQMTLYAAEINTVAARRLWPRSMFGPPAAPADERALDGARQGRGAPRHRADRRDVRPRTRDRGSGGAREAGRVGGAGRVSWAGLVGGAGRVHGRQRRGPRQPLPPAGSSRPEIAPYQNSRSGAWRRVIAVGHEQSPPSAGQPSHKARCGASATGNSRRCTPPANSASRASSAGMSAAAKTALTGRSGRSRNDVRDLRLDGPGAQRGQRVDELLGRVLLGHHGGRVGAGQAVGLVVDDQHPSARLAGDDVERADDQRPVGEHEREPLLAPYLPGGRQPRAQRAAREPGHELGDLLRRRLRQRPAGRLDRRRRGGGERAAEVELLEQRVDDDPALGGGEQRGPVLAVPRVSGDLAGSGHGRQSQHALGIEAVAAAAVLAEGGVAEPGHGGGGSCRWRRCECRGCPWPGRSRGRRRQSRGGRRQSRGHRRQTPRATGSSSAMNRGCTPARERRAEPAHRVQLLAPRSPRARRPTRSAAPARG